MRYHLALQKGSQGTWANCHKESTVVLCARRDIDYLPTDTWKYLGERIVTKRHLREHKINILSWINREFRAAFTALIID